MLFEGEKKGAFDEKTKLWDWIDVSLRQLFAKEGQSARKYMVRPKITLILPFLK